MNISLEGRVALVTGASRGLGRSIALALAAAGAHVGALARDRESLADLQAECERRALSLIALPADLTEPEDVSAAIDTLATQYGAPDILILNAAAMFRYGKMHRVREEDLRQQLEVNLISAMTLSQRLVSTLGARGAGRVIAIGSTAAQFGVRGSFVYNTSKAALEGFIRSIATEYGPTGTTANLLVLGPIATKRLTEREKVAPDLEQNLTRRTALDHLPLPEEVAHIVTFLASDFASIITGATIDVTAGSHLLSQWD